MGTKVISVIFSCENQIPPFSSFKYIQVSVAQSCPTLFDPMDCSPTGTSVHGILQARILDGLSFPSPGDLPDLGIEPTSPALQADALPSEPPGKPDNTTLIVETEEELKSLLMRAKEESEKAGLELNILKN